jgi:hypothetical protein
MKNPDIFFIVMFLTLYFISLIRIYKRGYETGRKKMLEELIDKRKKMLEELKNEKIIPNEIISYLNKLLKIE